MVVVVVLLMATDPGGSGDSGDYECKPIHTSDPQAEC